MDCKTAVLLALAWIANDHAPVQGARILAALPFFAGSHHRFSQPLLKALARAGHEVVVYSPFPLERPVPNYTDVFLENASIGNEGLNQLVLNFMSEPHYKCIDLFMDIFEISYNDFKQSSNIQQLLKSTEHFDLIIADPFIGQEFTLVLGHIFNAPVIAFQAFVNNNVVNDIFGNSLSLSHIPDTCSPFSDKMTIFERLRNSFSGLRNLYYVYHNTYIPSVEEQIRKDFPEAPPLWDMMNNVSLIFVNDHMTADYPQPRTPNIIPVAGIHIEDEKPLPTDIKRFMDEALDGVILFSLGTYVPDELQPREYFDMYCQVFRQLRQRVLWKTRKENIHGVPDNVMTIKWAPQRDILAHPNCVLFITHGGQLSQLETVHCGVPVVAISQFYDQHRNARFYEAQGVGVRLDNRDITESTVMAAIRTVLDDPKYAENMKRLSRVFRDRPLTPAETVVFWTEHVLRHGGSHLRPASTQLFWYQRALLDVLAVILAVLLSAAVILYFVSKTLFRYLCYKSKLRKIVHRETKKVN